MPKLHVYDPPMCCSTGVCGPAPDPELARIAADLDWLKGSGVEVERYNLAHQPAVFVAEPVVVQALHEKGNACLPLIVVDGQIVAEGRYPGREELARLAGLEWPSESEGSQGGPALAPGRPAFGLTVLSADDLSDRGNRPGPKCC